MEHLALGCIWQTMTKLLYEENPPLSSAAGSRLYVSVIVYMHARLLLGWHAKSEVRRGHYENCCDIRIDLMESSLRKIL